MRTASLRPFQLPRKNVTVVVSTTVTAVILTWSTYCCPPPSPWPVCPNTLQLGRHCSLAAKCNWALWGMPAEWVPQALQLGKNLGCGHSQAWGTRRQYCDHLIQVSSLPALGMLEKAKGIIDTQSLTRSRSQLASHVGTTWAVPASGNLGLAGSGWLLSFQESGRLGPNGGRGRIPWGWYWDPFLLFQVRQGGIELQNIMTFLIIRAFLHKDFVHSIYPPNSLFSFVIL